MVRPPMMLVALMVGTAVGLAFGYAIFSEAEPSPSSGDAIPAALALELASERAEVAQLRSEISRLEADIGSAADRHGARGAISASEESEATVGPKGGTALAERAPGDRWFDPARLAALGFYEADIERLRRAWEGFELDRLYIDNERARTPNGGRAHYFKFKGLERDTIEEVGEDGYDAMLFAAGQKNRVTVAHVLEDSVAARVGLEAGDEIVRYDDERLYSAAPLKHRTTACEIGTQIEIWIQRDGEARRYFVPCGPLGVNLGLESRPPL